MNYETRKYGDNNEFPVLDSSHAMMLKNLNGNCSENDRKACVVADDIIH
jgi:hypothetical protein